jgi:hypothetical protein
VFVSSLALLLLGLLGPPAPVPPQGERPTDEVEVDGMKLRRSNGGGFVYDDADAGFSAEIAADGTVRFRDRHVGPQKGKVSVLGFDLVRKGKREPMPQKPFRPDIVPYGPYGPAPIIAGVGGKMGGIADAKESSRKYAAKQEFLEITAPLRAELAKKARDKATTVALFELTHQLLATWNDPKLPLSVRKEQLFAAWDDCDEPGKGEKAAEHPGARARRRIETFIRVHAKRGSDHGFTDAELRDMNARRRSRQRFAPYGK